MINFVLVLVMLNFFSYKNDRMKEFIFYGLFFLFCGSIFYKQYQKDIDETDYIQKLSSIEIPKLKKRTFEDNLNEVLKEAYYSDTIHAYYINRYANLAASEHKKFGVPASIKLAQFIVEGGYSEFSPHGSRIVMQGNNPFGIKYFGENYPERIDNWESLAVPNDYVLARDDCGSSMCKFVKFNSIWSSFRYHSIFLVGTDKMPSHYKKYIDTGDWEDWVDALDKGRYASASSYSKTLNTIIKKYKLYLLDEIQP